jgi:hypothetical protein
MRRWILPVIDAVSIEEKLRTAESMFTEKRPNRQEAIAQLLNESDEWLAACAVYWIYAHGDSKLQRQLFQAAERPETLIKETAEALIERLNLQPQ